jgi:hypothetical protein
MAGESSACGTRCPSALAAERTRTRPARCSSSAQRRPGPLRRPCASHMGPEGQDVHSPKVAAIGARRADARRRRTTRRPLARDGARRRRAQPGKARVRRPADRRAAGPSPHVAAAGRRSGLSASTSRSGLTTFAIATGPRSPPRAHRCARCRRFGYRFARLRGELSATEPRCHRGACPSATGRIGFESHLRSSGRGLPLSLGETHDGGRTAGYCGRNSRPIARHEGPGRSRELSVRAITGPPARG